jgi:mono/diheme cytochrome c family protein
VPEGLTVAHGGYVAQMCKGCHGPDLAGGRVPGAPPDWPPAPALHGDASVMAGAYADPEAFVQMLRSGVRADGSRIQVMPFEALGRLSDTDARALHLALREQPARVATR